MNNPSNNYTNPVPGSLQPSVSPHRTVRLFPKILVTAALGLLLANATGNAATLVSWGGDYLTTSLQNFVLPTATDNSGVRTYEYSASTAIDPGSGVYSGPKFYGALQNNSGTSTPADFDASRVIDNSGTNQIRVWGNTPSAGITNTITGLIFFKPTLNIGETASFGVSDQLNMTISMTGASRLARFAVLNNGQWYLSDDNFTANGAKSITPNGEMWGAWNPTGAPLASTPGSYTTNGSTFTDIEAVGYYFNISNTGANSRIDLTSYTATGTVVPEPGIVGLLACAGMGWMGVRRRNRTV
ncbi:MAG: PEP-CTERM sorting domain-containing protein [Chthoniobacterales bacterium]|nr:PEP-CTERM sorting domain-containing protein [Chthoniobacterales bacterium]